MDVFCHSRYLTLSSITKTAKSCVAKNLKNNKKHQAFLFDYYVL